MPQRASPTASCRSCRTLCALALNSRCCWQGPLSGCCWFSGPTAWVARPAGRRCFMLGLSVNVVHSSRKAALARWFAAGQGWSRELRVPFEHVFSGARAGAAAGLQLGCAVLRGLHNRRGRNAPALTRSGKCCRRSGVAAAEQAPACRPVLARSERLRPLQNASRHRPAHNPSIERTCPSKLGHAAHVER